MKDLHPALTEKQIRERREAVELCGKNRGPHDYIPIEWITDGDTKRVTRMICRVCFANVSIRMLVEHYREVRL